MQRERLEKELRLRVVDHDRAARRGHTRRRERGEAPAGDADMRLPVRADRIECTAQDGADAACHAFDTFGLEICAARLDRLDGEAGFLEPAQDPLPLFLSGSGILLGKDELGTVGERLGETHPRTHARLLGGGGTCP